MPGAAQSVALAGRPSRGLVVQLAAVAGTVVYTMGNAFLAGGLGVAGRAIGLDELQVGTILSLGALAGVVAAPLWGYASEAWSRRRLMLLAVPLMALGPAAMALAFWQVAALSLAVMAVWLAAARLVQAAFGAALIPVTQSYVAELTPPGRRVSGMGLLSMAVSFGTLSGSALLWLTARFGVATGFLAVAALGGIAFVIVVLFLPETRTQQAPVREEGTVPFAWLWPNFAITFLGFLAYTLVQPILGYRLMDRVRLEAHDAAGQAGLLLTVSALALIAAQAAVALRRQWNAVAMLRVGSLGALAGSLALLLVQDVLGLALAMALVGIALGFMAPANLGAISLATGRGAQGKVGGINMAARSLGVAIGPIAGTSLYKLSPDAPFWGAAIMVGAILALSLLRRRR